MTFDLKVLLDYTAWQRERWETRLLELGDGVLETSMGPHGDGRFSSVGDIIRHMFSAEFRYAQRIAGEPVSEVAKPREIAALFQLGKLSRDKFTSAVTSLHEVECDEAREYLILNTWVKATPRKFALHTLMHEIRHWAQVATILRLEGFPGETHDILMSPVLGGSIRSAESGT